MLQLTEFIMNLFVFSFPSTVFSLFPTCSGFAMCNMLGH